MQCPICGSDTAWGSKFCQKCGKRISDIAIKKEDVLDILAEKNKKIKSTEGKMKYDKLIKRIKGDEIKSIRLRYASVDNEQLLDEVDYSEFLGNLSIEANPELFVGIGAIFIANEIDSIHNEIAQISMKIHDDRIAHIEAAFRQYKRALKTVNIDNKERTLDFTANECILGLSMLRKELERHLEYFEKLPRNVLKKLISGTSVGEAIEELAQCQEAFYSYCAGVRLLIETDSLAGEIDRVEDTIEEETEYLITLKKHNGYERLLEIDDENAEKWKDMVANLGIDMYYIQNCIENKEIKLNLK